MFSRACCLGEITLNIHSNNFFPTQNSLENSLRYRLPNWHSTTEVCQNSFLLALRRWGLIHFSLKKFTLNFLHVVQSSVQKVVGNFPSKNGYFRSDLAQVSEQKFLFLHQWWIRVLLFFHQFNNIVVVVMQQHRVTFVYFPTTHSFQDF